MICPRCKNHNVDIVPLVKSEKVHLTIVFIIQIFSLFALIFSFIGIIIMLITSTEELIEALSKEVITIADCFEGILDLQYEKLCYCFILLKLIKCSFWIFIISTIARLFLPYRSYTTLTYCCKECELQWQKTQNQQQNTMPNQIYHP